MASVFIKVTQDDRMEEGKDGEREVGGGMMSVPRGPSTLYK